VQSRNNLPETEEKLKDLESTCNSLSNIVSHTEELDSPMTPPPHGSQPHAFRSTSEVLTMKRKREVKGG